MPAWPPQARICQQLLLSIAINKSHVSHFTIVRRQTPFPLPYKERNRSFHVKKTAQGPKAAQPYFKLRPHQWQPLLWLLESKDGILPNSTLSWTIRRSKKSVISTWGPLKGDKAPLSLREQTEESEHGQRSQQGILLLHSRDLARVLTSAASLLCTCLELWLARLLHHQHCMLSLLFSLFLTNAFWDQLPRDYWTQGYSALK